MNCTYDLNGRNYIYHRRHDDRHGYGNFLYNHFEKFVQEICEEGLFGLEMAATPSSNDYTTPFDRNGVVS